MPRGRPAREPSGRNLEIYHELVCEGRLRQVQAGVAARGFAPRDNVVIRQHERVRALPPPGETHGARRG